LDRNLISQYGIWLGKVVQGDLGYSYYLGKPVTRPHRSAHGAQFVLGFGHGLAGGVCGCSLGYLGGLAHGGVVGPCVVGVFGGGIFGARCLSIAYGLIYVFAIRLQWLPVQGYKPLFGPQASGVGEWLRQLVLPWLTLGTIYIALIARMTRASVSEALSEDYRAHRPCQRHRRDGGVVAPCFGECGRAYRHCDWHWGGAVDRRRGRY
jgi:peptide/nickel transport system permease protein